MTISVSVRSQRPFQANGANSPRVNMKMQNSCSGRVVQRNRTCTDTSCDVKQCKALADLVGIGLNGPMLYSLT